MQASHDRANWAVEATVRKYAEDAAAWLADGRTIADFQRDCRPSEVRHVRGNMLVNAGIALLEDLLIGAGGTVFSNANARLGVGDSATAAAAGQTDLQAATNKLRKAMDATFPSRSAQTLTFQASFTGAEANFAWNEWAIFNAAAAGTMLNRKAEALGTKSSGTWVLAVTITIS
jgi:hypothetical protein